MDASSFRMYIPDIVSHDFPVGITSFSDQSTPIGKAEFGGRLKGTSGTGFTRHRVYGMYALVLLLNGGGRYRDCRGMDRRLSPGDQIVIFPEHPHQYGPEAGDDWDEVFIAFKGAAFDGWRTRGLAPENPVWRPGDPDSQAQRFFSILRMPCASLVDATAVASSIHNLIADSLQHLASPRVEWIDRAKQLLGSGEALEPRAIAAHFGMSSDHFRKIFKAETGESPTVFQRRRRLAQAALMLRRHDLKLDIIAESLGFCDGFHLSKAFKKEFGKSPAAFRETET